MSDTRERTVAEIIGLASPAYAATPDDMLAWLRKRVVANGLHFYVNPLESYTVTAWLTQDDHRSGHAPTLHAALEAAVRAVAEASDG